MTRLRDDKELALKNARTGLAVIAFVFFMIGVSFAAVPLYDLFCRVTGFGGTPQTSESFPDKVIDRVVTIKFNADTGRNMPWKFSPEMREVDVHMGERGLTAYEAYNPMAMPVGGTALYNVTPPKVGKYFNKVQCFCFDEQVLQPGQRVSMPVMFFIDPAMADDPNMQDVSAITLSYTFYRAGTKELDTALNRFYNEEEITQ